ncbi:sigma-54-dependent Fis family transcriptional regulator [Clostridium paraputrificum]|uniref:sigma-54-dependent Fis family transcriptional regulator n=1 Tax=Clostridium TaxID=1485 RepID=UPI003D351B15
MMGNYDNSIIKDSHERSRAYGVRTEGYTLRKALEIGEVNNLLKKNSDLVKVAKIYMDMFNDVLQDEHFVIVLTDKDGCVLYINGQKNVVKEYEKSNIVVGMYMDEKSVGTNAMGTAIKENRPVQVTADEHYIDIFKKLTCSAAPIHGKNGEIIGTLNLTSQWTEKHLHSLGLVLFGVKAIENELEKIHSKEILEETYNYMGSLMENYDKGIILVNELGRIKKVNDLVTEIIQIPEDILLNKNIQNIIPTWKNIMDGFKVNKYKVYTKDVKLNDDIKKRTLISIKPIRLNDRVIGNIITFSKTEDNNKVNITGAYKSFDDIIGESDVILNVITNCKVVANSPSTILIEGESGTGKEVFAQAIHNYSYRRNEKFIAINCGAIPKNLIESELFGYDDGAFTGAKKGGKPGKFEQANGGTLFLDEIGEMPLEMQVHLLRVLQEGRVTRIGGEKEIPIDVRIIAATNKNLKKEIKEKRFREDLYYRLSVIPIKIPPLRERKGDVEKLIEYFLMMKTYKLSKCHIELKGILKNNLINYTWPGNIRELENCIENIVNLDGEMSYDILDKMNINEDRNIQSSQIENESNKIIKINLEEYSSIKEIEREIINRAIEINNYNISKTAKELGVSRNTLYYKNKR